MAALLHGHQQDVKFVLWHPLKQVFGGWRCMVRQRDRSIGGPVAFWIVARGRFCKWSETEPKGWNFEFREYALMEDGNANIS